MNNSIEVKPVNEILKAARSVSGEAASHPADDGRRAETRTRAMTSVGDRLDRVQEDAGPPHVHRSRESDDRRGKDIVWRDAENFEIATPPGISKEFDPAAARRRQIAYDAAVAAATAVLAADGGAIDISHTILDMSADANTDMGIGSTTGRHGRWRTEREVEKGVRETSTSSTGKSNSASKCIQPCKRNMLVRKPMASAKPKPIKRSLGDSEFEDVEVERLQHEPSVDDLHDKPKIASVQDEAVDHAKGKGAGSHDMGMGMGRGAFGKREA